MLWVMYKAYVYHIRCTWKCLVDGARRGRRVEDGDYFCAITETLMKELVDGEKEGVKCRAFVHCFIKREILWVRVTEIYAIQGMSYMEGRFVMKAKVEPEDAVKSSWEVAMVFEEYFREGVAGDCRLIEYFDSFRCFVT